MLSADSMLAMLAGVLASAAVAAAAATTVTADNHLGPQAGLLNAVNRPAVDIPVLLKMLLLLASDIQGLRDRVNQQWLTLHCRAAMCS